MSVLAFAALATSAPAATIVVGETADELNQDADCSLREAIRAANLDAAVDACAAGTGEDTVVVPAGEYQFSAALDGEDDAAAVGDLDITGRLTLRGAGATVTMIDANALDRALHVLPGAIVTVSDLTIREGQTGSGGLGGGILNTGVLTVTSSVITQNSAWAGAGIRNFNGHLTIIRTTLSDNVASVNGGALSSARTGVNDPTNVTLTRSVVDANSAPTGAGIYFSGARLAVTATTISENVATSAGGGLKVDDGIVTVKTSTITGNSAPAGGGGILIGSANVSASFRGITVRRNVTNGAGGGVTLAGSATLVNSTISRNTAADGDGIASYGTSTLTNVTVSGNGSIASGGRGGGIFVSLGSLELRNATVTGNIAGDQAGDGENAYNNGATLTARSSIIASDLSGGNCGGTLISLGNNLEWAPSSAPTCGFELAGDPKLRPLRNNGGRTATHAIAADSAARNRGASCAATDQRGVPRPQGRACDIGAYELAFCLGGVVNRVGTRGNDRMVGGAANEVFLMLAGNDTVNPRGGRDRACMGRGKDRLVIKSAERDSGDGGRGRHDRVVRDARDSTIRFEIVG